MGIGESSLNVALGLGETSFGPSNMSNLASCFLFVFCLALCHMNAPIPRMAKTAMIMPAINPALEPFASVAVEASAVDVAEGVLEGVVLVIGIRTLDVVEILNPEYMTLPDPAQLEGPMRGTF
jgi:hypothetical protein